MASYFSLHAYDADVWIRGFRGLNQGDLGMNPDINYAAEAENVETPGGVLQPQAPCEEEEGDFGARVETLAGFTRRWYSGLGSKEWYICCSAGHFYYRQQDSQLPWVEIELPSGVTAYQKSLWSYVTYEINRPSDNITVDVLLLSNDTDGMIMIIPPDVPTTHADLQEFTHEGLAAKTHKELTSPSWQIRTVDTGDYKFGVIERYAERIWGGAILDEPDLLVYSRPYDPTDWTAPGADEQPEDGAGEIRQPSWDGDKFYAIKRFGDQLLAFKKHRIWRVSGVSPGEYVFQEQFADGTAYFNTIAVEQERVLMATKDGLLAYDGMSSSPYARTQVEQIWRTINPDALDQMCAALYQNRYYLAFPVGDSPVNNAMLVYNMTEGTILYYSDFQVESFLPTDQALYMTTSSLPGRVLRVLYDSWQVGKTAGKAARWVSPWMDFGYKRIQKGGFDFYFYPEVQDEAVTLRISIQTEKKTKTKLYTVNRTVKEHRFKRIHFGGSGRKFRVIIETDENITVPWRLVGGVQMVVETDPD